MAKFLLTLFFCIGLVLSGCINQFQGETQTISSAATSVEALAPTENAIQEISQESNFSFVIKDYPCGSDFYDSVSHTLIHENVDGAGPFTIKLKLTQDELIQIFNKAVETNFFDLPEILAPPENSNKAIQAPSSIYELSITNENITHSVLWNDEITTVPLYKDAEQFRDLFMFIHEIIRSHDEYQQIPEDQAGCA